MSNISSKVPAWALVVIFLGLITILGIFGDLFTFIVGTLIMTLVFANGYDREHLEDHWSYDSDIYKEACYYS